MIAVKVPIGLIVVMLIGLFLFFTRRIPPNWILPCAIVLSRGGLVFARAFEGRDLCRNSSRFACGCSAFRFRGDQF